LTLQNEEGGGGERAKKRAPDDGKKRLARNAMYRITFLGETSDREEATMQQKLRQYTENYATATFCSHNQGENERAKTDDVICWGKKPYVGYFGDAK
jgi:hypothetical protein